MPARRRHTATGLVGQALATLAVASPMALPAQPATGAADLARCRALAVPAERLACYDAIVDGAFPPPPPAPPVAANPVTVPAGSVAPAAAAVAPPTPEDLFGLDPARSDARVREAAGIGRVEELPLRVTEVRRDATGKAVLAFDNGQAWAQLDSTSVRLAPGDAVVIRRAAFGSFLLVPATGNRSIWVRRIR